jgi:hypothetical protein
MSVDFRWQSQGGILLDGSGDIATTDPSTMESTVDVVRSRLKASLNGWKLYAIGADLQARVGDIIAPELEIALQRQVYNSLTNSFLPRGSFTVETLSFGDTVRVLVFISQTLIAQATVSRTSQTLVIS